MFDHRIDIDVRIRDIDRWDEGTIVLWTDDAAIVEVRPGQSGFDGYSEALEGREGSWNEKNLDHFLRDVDAFAPGSTMYFPGTEDDAIRSTVIEYLNSLSDYRS